MTPSQTSLLWNLRTYALLGKIFPVKLNTACINKSFKWFSFCSGKCHIWCTPRLSPWPCPLSSIHINDITNKIQSNKTVCRRLKCIEIRSPADHHILQTDIQKLTDWSNKWQINFNKCHLLTITYKPKPSKFTYTISNQLISRVNSHPYLGVTIDAKLSWTKHIHNSR